ncbi:hypothetical protein L227DRAFT_160654 [Lentinus tigrinus ALCF2SS1-6]|uniref:Uncharacterized protein n=1 Tax=Lentinus tigrinus ALCF2SS1-6 TaxID=1328759 RepID=A0A5C2S8M2_9APHY|nr:hypothetical protein L227DRAFT_160654 [Lentinus tigrinus ALCF2SS1-6]
MLKQTRAMGSHLSRFATVPALPFLFSAHPVGLQSQGTEDVYLALREASVTCILGVFARSHSFHFRPFHPFNRCVSYMGTTIRRSNRSCANFTSGIDRSPPPYLWACCPPRCS